MGLQLESPSPKRHGFVHCTAQLELDIMEDSFVTHASIDDLSRIVAASTSQIRHPHDKAITSSGDVGSCSQVNQTFAQKRDSFEIDSVEAPQEYGWTPLKHVKGSSRTISFGHPDAYTETCPSPCSYSRKRTSVYGVLQEQVQSVLICAENNLRQNIQPTLCQGDIGDLVAFGGKGKTAVDSHSSLKISLSANKLPDPSSSSKLKEKLSAADHKFGKDAYGLSKHGSHIMAERRRREKLNQMFISLAAIVPGLKKVDKATILADAVKYVKQLEEQLKLLEDHVPNMVNSVDIRKSDEAGSYGPPGRSLGTPESVEGSVQEPDIEARVVGKNVLIHVHCGKIESVLVKALEELEKLHLSVVNANVLSFSSTTLDLTFTAQIEEDNRLTAHDIVKALHTFFRKLK